MKRTTRISAWAIATVLGMCAASWAAGPLDDRVPQDAIMYVGWAGADALAPQYGNSNLKGVVEASTAKKFISEQLPKLIEQASRNDPNAPAKIAKMQTVLAMAWRHPTAFYFCPVDFSNPQQPEFRFGLLCDAGADGKAAMDLMNEAMAQNPAPPELPIKASQQGSMLSITFGKADTDADRRKGGGLAGEAKYAKAMGQVKQATPAIAMYMDIAGGVAMFNDAFAKMPAPPEVKAKAPIVIDALGLNSLTQMAMTSGFDGKGWSEQAFVGVSGPKKGILTVMSDQPLSPAALAAVPKEAVMMSALKLDLQKIFGEARTVIGKIDDGALKEFDNQIAQVNQGIGLNIEQDIIAPFGDEWVFYRAPNEDVGGLSFVLAQKLRDGDRLSKTLAVIEAKINEAAGGRFKIDKTTVSKIDVSSVSFLQYSLAWTVRNGYLYVSSIDGIGAAIKQVENKSPSIVENDLYKAAMARMPQGIKPTGISYANPAKLYPEMRRTLLGVLPLARAAGFDLPADLLPDTGDISQYLTPGAQVGWWDADGLHAVGRSAFPGSQIIGGNPSGSTSVAVAAGGAALLLPSLGRSREMALRSVDMANERGLAQSCIVEAANNNDNMPDDLAKLIVDGDISPKQLVSKRAGTAPLQMTPELAQLAQADFAKFSQQVAAHTDYVYLGKGTKADTDASIVVIYEKPGPQTRDGMSVAFGDAHAEFIRMGPQIEEIFGPTNEMLKKKGLPTVDVQEILRKSNELRNATPPAAAAAPAGRGRP